MKLRKGPLRGNKYRRRLARNERNKNCIVNNSGKKKKHHKT